MRIKHITPVFVEAIPNHIENGKLYISDTYDIAIHKCCCGCGEEVVTPLSPVDWQYENGSKGVSLYPSIGNWSYQCKSHYIIRNGEVVWAASMSQAQINRVQQRDIADKQQYIAQRNAESGSLFGLLHRLWTKIKDFFVK